jgi:serine O-acetyltransferase
MRTTLPAADLATYTLRLDANHLPDGATTGHDLAMHVAVTLERIEHSFSHIHRKYYRDGADVTFDHLNADHMAAYLYFLGNTIWTRTGDATMPTRLSYLNKIMNGLDLFYSVAMPDIFLLVHPVGTVLGKARYSDYFVVYQNCTVGADTTVYPSFEEEVILYSRASVLGETRVGRNVVFAANSMVVDAMVPPDSVVVGQYPAHRFVGNERSVRDRCFNPVPDQRRA